MLLKSPFIDAERTFNVAERISTSMNEDLILLNIEKQIGAATFSVEHLCL